MEQPLHLDKDLQYTDGMTTTSHTPDQSPSPVETSTSSSSPTLTRPVVDTSIYPGGRKSLSAIALRAFLLGATLGICSVITLFILLVLPHIIVLGSDSALLRLWRPVFFLSALSLFHFLEYFITALHNTQYANVSAFLLSTNGRAYNAAHTAAFLECILTSVFLPGFQDHATGQSTILIGVCMLVVGQFTRTVAMAVAGTNFNHTVQTKRNEGHTLVTRGIYVWLRHPSYFGFFWWGVGTQVILGNVVCGTAYTFVLWNFFYRRIRKEEELLVKFFGEEYQQYRRRTRVGIPFIS